jgi:phosphoribosylformylglycinamidine cyclo-ligase
VASTDGVGTKLKIAFALDKHDSIGIDLVAMSVNDIAVMGARPLFFLDYYATSKLDVDQAEAVITGIQEGCRQAGCVLLGGETAEMPGFYQPSEYDLSGFAVGEVRKEDLIDGSQIEAGHAIIGLASSGLHSNGYSLVHRILEQDNISYAHRPTGWEESLGEALLTPTRIYVPALSRLCSEIDVRGLCHITGGGLYENIARVLPEGLGAKLQKSAWQLPELFKWLIQHGQVGEAEAHRTWNMGLGMVAIVPEAEIGQALDSGWMQIGEVNTRGKVELC